MNLLLRAFSASLSIARLAAIVSAENAEVQTYYDEALAHKKFRDRSLSRNGASPDAKKGILQRKEIIGLHSNTNISDDGSKTKTADIPGGPSSPSLRAIAITHVDDEQNAEYEGHQDVYQALDRESYMFEATRDYDAGTTDLGFCGQPCFAPNTFSCGPPCNSCQNGICVAGGPVVCPQGQRSCANNFECQQRLPGCPFCINFTCRTNNIRTCINNEAQLRAAIQVGGTHKICAVNPINVSREINTNASNVRLVCDSGTSCKIQATSGNRLFRVTGNQWTVQGIIFQNGGFRGSVREGGAFYFENGVVSASFSNCQFVNNHAMQSGGAVFAASGQVQFNQCVDAGNYAPQCSFARVSGSCRQPYFDEEDRNTDFLITE